MRVYREARCATCKKFKDDPIHGPPPAAPPLLYKLLHIAWPRWRWVPKSKHHPFKTDAEFKAAEMDAAQLRRKLVRLKNRRREL